MRSLRPGSASAFDGIVFDLPNIGRAPVLLEGVRANLPVVVMELTASALERIVIVRFERGIALLPELAHLRFDRRLVDAGHRVMLVGLDAERLAERGQQMVLVQLRIAL